MSTSTDPQKHAAPEAAPEEPSSKKAKLEGDASVNNVDNNNGTASDNNKLVPVSDNGVPSLNASGSNSNIPSKANGKDKEPKPDQDDDVEEDDDDDEDCDDSDCSDVFDPKVAGKLEEVEEIQSQISKLNELASEEILKVEQKFNQLRRPHYERRNNILKEVPNFWVTTLANHPLIAPMIDSAEVEDCLHYMVNLDVEECEDIKSGYKLHFYFVANPYIENEVLTKALSNGEDSLVAPGSPVRFKDTDQGKGLQQVVERSTAQIRRNKALGPNSFFAWLIHHQTQSTDDIAEIIKDQIWPSPLEFFFSAPDDYNGGSDESDDEDEYEEEVDNDGEVDLREEEILDEDLDNEEDLDDEDDEDDIGDDDDDDDDDDDEEDD